MTSFCSTRSYSRLLGAVIAKARESGKPVFVDPKGAGWERYQGANVLKPNRLELGILAGMPAATAEETAAAGRHLSSKLAGAKVVVTEGAEGMTLYAAGERVAHAAAAPRQVFDVTGAGDTVLAALAMAFAAGATDDQALALATEAASIAIGTMGTAVVNLDQLRASITSS